MADLWYGILAASVVLYAVLDGFDLGAGVLHRLLARDARERAQILGAIGPWWDANEVWLLAAFGAFLIAFPRAMAATFSGFYLPLFLVLWCLVGRGVSIESRHVLAHPLWTSFWDTAFSGTSALLAFLFGALAGNLVRGVPLDGSGWFGMPLFASGPGEVAGFLDPFTIATGVFAVLVLAAHAASFLAWRCSGGVEVRARRWSLRLGLVSAGAWAALLFAAERVRPGIVSGAMARPGELGFLLAAVLSLGVAIVSSRNAGSARGAGLAFAASTLFLGAVLAATAAALHPVLLEAIGDPARSLRVANAAAAAGTLRSALVWWTIAMPLVAGGFVLIGRAHRARTALAART
jgi:cytochrome d ubiquinol oxidase subunit II